MPKLPCLLLGEHHNLPGLLGEALEHSQHGSRGAGATDENTRALRISEESDGARGRFDRVRGVPRQAHAAQTPVTHSAPPNQDTMTGCPSELANRQSGSRRCWWLSPVNGSHGAYTSARMSALLWTPAEIRAGLVGVRVQLSGAAGAVTKAGVATGSIAERGEL
jgi:hypothetical protein